MDLAAFEGVWTLERRIEDARDPRPARFDGTALFTAAPGGLAYLEEGRLTLGDAAPFAASRRYFWRARAGRIAVEFEDGRPFHDFDPRAGAPAAEHDCAPDHYRVAYDFTGWPDWRAEWRVSGPRKDYRMISAYRPAGQFPRSERLFPRQAARTPAAP